MPTKRKATGGALDYVYDAANKGVCCTLIHVRLRGEVIDEVRIDDGCPGNHLGIEALVRGRKAREVIEGLLGTPCGDRSTSCPDQLAKALQEALNARRT